MSFKRSMPARLAEIDSVCADIKAWLLVRNLGQEHFGVTLLAREALVNAVVYGAAMDAGKTIELLLDLTSDHLVMSVEDPGPGFGWRALLNREVPVAQDHGRGMMIFHAYASEFDYNETGNRITLRKKLDARRKP